MKNNKKTKKTKTETVVLITAPYYYEFLYEYRSAKAWMLLITWFVNLEIIQVL